MHRIFVTGVIGREVKTITGDFGEFHTTSIGVSNGKKRDGTYKDTTWYELTFASHFAKFLVYVGKGSKVIVDGTPSDKVYEGKIQRTIKVDNIEFISSKDDSNSTPTAPQPQVKTKAPDANTEIPVF